MPPQRVRPTCTNLVPVLHGTGIFTLGKQHICPQLGIVACFISGEPTIPQIRALFEEMVAILSKIFKKRPSYEGVQP